MAQSFQRRWPDECQPLVVYAEDFEPDVGNVETRALPGWLADFKTRFAAHNGWRNGRYNYIHDAVKFAHKVAALTDYALTLTDGVLIWLDADIYTHSDVTPEWLERLFPEPAYLAWLDRINSHPECGVVFFRCSHPHHHTFMANFRNLYMSGDLFKLRETHDSFALWHLVSAKVRDRKILAPVSLSGAAVRTSHPAANGPISACLDHLKGKRKQIGRTPCRERFLVQDGNKYWSVK